MKEIPSEIEGVINDVVNHLPEQHRKHAREALVENWDHPVRVFLKHQLADGTPFEYHASWTKIDQGGCAHHLGTVLVVAHSSRGISNLQNAVKEAA